MRLPTSSTETRRQNDESERMAEYYRIKENIFLKEKTRVDMGKRLILVEEAKQNDCSKSKTTDIKCNETKMEILSKND